MDNKITKKRLVSFLSYEWIKVLVIIVAAIVFFEVLFTVTAVRLSSGQQFKLIYDEKIDTNFNSNLLQVTCVENDKSLFSYEVQKIDAETMLEGKDNVLSVRYETKDVDVVITHKTQVEGENVRVKTLIDNLDCWSFEKALTDCENYLSAFLKDGVINNELSKNQAVYDYNNLDQGKIEDNFKVKHKKDNRFRSQKNYQLGLELERERIKNIVADMTDVKYLLENHSEIFFRYTKYEQIVTNMPLSSDYREEAYKNYCDLYAKETEQSYAIDIEKLSNGKYSVADYFTKDGLSKDVVLISFDYINLQPDLQFETLRFITSVVRNFSNFLDE